jgi:hypothetical protein
MPLAHIKEKMRRKQAKSRSSSRKDRGILAEVDMFQLHGTQVHTEKEIRGMDIE